jgi:hypothetical protein
MALRDSERESERLRVTECSRPVHAYLALAAMIPVDSIDNITSTAPRL